MPVNVMLVIAFMAAILVLFAVVAYQLDKRMTSLEDWRRNEERTRFQIRRSK